MWWGFFSLDKFLEDCERERHSKRTFAESPKDRGIIPMYFPADDQTLDGIREIAEKGNPKSADHTLENVDAFRLWENTINAAARKKINYPQISDTVIERIQEGTMIP
jgi:trimethylamine--corrinoid protein Co-methyltransferase